MNACISGSVKGQYLSSGWEGGHAQARCIKLQSALVVVLAHARNCRFMYLQGNAWAGSGQHKLGEAVMHRTVLTIPKAVLNVSDGLTWGLCASKLSLGVTRS